LRIWLATFSKREADRRHPFRRDRSVSWCFDWCGKRGGHIKVLNESICVCCGVFIIFVFCCSAVCVFSVFFLFFSLFVFFFFFAFLFFSCFSFFFFGLVFFVPSFFFCFFPFFSFFFFFFFFFFSYVANLLFKPEKFWIFFFEVEIFSLCGSASREDVLLQ